MSSEIDNQGRKLEIVDESMNESKNLSLNMRETMTNNLAIVTPTVKKFAEDLPPKPITSERSPQIGSTAVD
jgi:hypothetical protein